MDIHRCRFVPYPPSTINVLAFSHSHIPSKKSKSKTPAPRLAIGRANGDIEIWNPLNGAWLQETILKGGKDRSVDGLAWIQDPDEEDGAGNVIQGRLRLFSIGYTTTVTEWDLEKGQPLRHASGNHGEIWCLAAQPALSSLPQQMNGVKQGAYTGQNLVTGCTDGAVVLYSTEDSDLKLKKVIVRPSSKKAKVISITFQNRTTVIAGCTDSNIRIVDIQNGALIRSVSLGAGPSGGPKEIIVWAVKCLPNGNIVSGDSTGELRIWDAKTFTLSQRIKSHKQDILSLATSADGSSIFSGGMDRRTTVYKQVGQAGRQRWAEVSHRRYHDHDVKTMATFEGKGLSVVVSGGPDASPIVLPLKEFGLENQRALPHLPQDSIIHSAPGRRLVMSFWDREISIWRIYKNDDVPQDADDSENEEEEVRPRKLVAKILIGGQANITSASISADGYTMAVATATDVKLFYLKPSASEGDDSLIVSKYRDTPRDFSSKGARLVQISPDGKWLAVVRNDNQITTARLIPKNGGSTKMLNKCSTLHRLDRNIEKHVLLGGVASYERKVSRVVFSSDSRILVASDLAGYIDSWVLEGTEDLSEPIVVASEEESANEDDDDMETPVLLFGQHWIQNPSGSLIPKLPSTPTVLSFRPATDKLSVKTNGLSPHPTRHNPHPVSHELPAGEDRLLVVTAGSVGTAAKVLEFNVLKGSLTAWSRRNPIANFPEEYKGLRDQAMGCVWDVSEDKERVWLYGSSWLWMFDLSRDFPVHKSSIALTNGHSNHDTTVDHPRPSKRQRIEYEDQASRKNTSGAGSKVRDDEIGTGMSRKMYRFVTGEKEEEVRDINRTGDEMDVDEDDEDDEEDELIRQSSRSGGEEDVAMTNGSGPPHWWNTYKYRPIMGIVPIGSSETTEFGPEVALIERPIWEADLPPRYYGDQEWEKPGVE